MALETRLFINNEYVNSASGETLTINNPFNDQLVTDQVQVAGADDVDQAVSAASAAFQVWRAMSSTSRATIMLKSADLVEAHREKIAELETLCMGVPQSLANMIVAFLTESFRFYAGLADKVHGDVFNEDGDGMLKMTSREPIGVCAGISAWNGTPLSVGWKIAPAVAAGNTVIHKTSEKSPLSTAFLGSLVVEAGFPPGVINLLAGTGATGELIASHMGIRKISFTGSISAGRKVQMAATRSNLKHCTLELGGKSASIVFEDADIENAVLHNSERFLLNGAQGCSAASRLFIHTSIASDFIQRLQQSWAKYALSTGDPTLKETFLGPMADKVQRQRVQEFIDEARRDGTEVLFGAQDKTGPGQWVAPTIFLNPKLESKIYQEEVFGPVLVVRTFTAEDEVVKLANDTEYGLSGIIFTSNLSRGLRLASKLDVGTLSINSAHFPHKQTPWGGWKQSGYGREGGLEGLEEYLQTKSIHINLQV